MSKDVDQKAREDALLHVVGFEGELRAEKHSASMRWSVTIGRHGGIALTFEATTVTAENKWLFEAAFPDGPLLQPLSINGKTSDGVTCSTDSLGFVDQDRALDAIVRHFRQGLCQGDCGFGRRAHVHRSRSLYRGNAARNLSGNDRPDCIVPHTGSLSHGSSSARLKQT